MRKKIPGRDDLREFLALFDGESDRAAVVLGGAYLDACLEETLRTWLSKDVDEHFEPPRGFLASYGAKYLLAHALGAIDADDRKKLQHIGSIRNHFAHHVLDARWNDPGIQKHMRALRQGYGAARRFGFGDRDIYLMEVATLDRRLRDCEKENLHRMRTEALVRALRNRSVRRR